MKFLSRSSLLLGSIICTGIFVSGCAGVPSIVPQTSYPNASPQSDNQTLPAGRDIEQANAFLAEGKKREAASAYFAAANNYRSPYRERLILQAAELASIFRDTDLTQRYLAPISNIPLNPENQARFRFTQAQLALNDRNYREALRLLPRRVSHLPSGLASKILNTRMNAAQSSGDKLSLVQELVLQESTLTSAHEKKLNNDRIWGHIKQLPLEKLNEGRRNIAHPTIRSWLDLAHIQKTNRNNQEALQSKVTHWKSRNQNHPGVAKISEIIVSDPVATTSTYKDGSVTTTNTATTPPKVITSTVQQSGASNNISVILPLSGNLKSVGNSILSGIKAAHKSSNQSSPLKVYDSNSGNITQLYQKAVSEGARVVIGPFNKSKISALSSSPFTRPTLALNYLSNSSGNNKTNLYQFGLSPEDEATQVAQLAISQGNKRVAIVTPDSSWGKRLNETMRRSIIERGGKVVINKNYVNSGNNFTYISKSISTKLDSVDAILLAASPTQIQRIYPTFRQDIEELPIYATSHVFSGIQDAGKNANLEGLIFTETPMIMDLVNNGQTPPTKYPRLFALGMDALMISSNGGLLQNSGNTFNGKTGRVSRNSDGTLHRKLMWAKFVSGKPVLYNR